MPVTLLSKYIGPLPDMLNLEVLKNGRKRQRVRITPKGKVSTTPPPPPTAAKQFNRKSKLPET